MKKKKNLKAARFELAPVKTGALNQRLRPLGHASSWLMCPNYKGEIILVKGELIL